MKKKIIMGVLFVIFVLAFPLLLSDHNGITGAAIVEPQDSSSISACQSLVNGEYLLTQNVSAAEICFTILNNSITLDCQGFTINYSQTSRGRGIVNSGGFDNIIIKNCQIQDSRSGWSISEAIYFLDVSNSTIENNRFYPMAFFTTGISLDQSHNNTIINNSFTIVNGTVFDDSSISAAIYFNGTTSLSGSNQIINNNFSSYKFSLYFQNYTTADYLSTNNTLSYNNSNGAINWTRINLTTSANLSIGTNIFLSNNTVGIADLNFTGGGGFDGIPSTFNLNTSASIEIKNLTYQKQPDLLKLGLRCDNSTEAIFKCNLTYNPTLGVVYANVTSFSNYTTQENDPPTVIITSPLNGSNHSFTPRDFNATVSDVHTAVDAVIFAFNNGTGNPFNRSANNNSGIWNYGQLNFSIFKEGLQGVAVSANDTFNNINYTQFINFTVDFTPPNVTINFLNNPVNDSNFSFRSNNRTFNASVFDTFTEVNNVHFWFDNGTGNDVNGTAVNQSGSWIVSYNVSSLQEQRQGLRIMANDTVGNLNNSFVINFTVDFTPPNVTINFLNNPVNDSNFSFRSNNRTFNASVFDTFTEVNNVHFWFDNGTGNDVNGTAVNQSGNWIVSYNVSSLQEQRQGLRIMANDTVGNLNNSFVINFTVDFTPPNVTVNSLNNPASDSNFSIRSNNRTFNASIFDVLTEVNNVHFWFDNGTGNDVNGTAVNQSGNWIVSYNVSSLQEQRQGLRIMANDTVSNLNNSVVINFTVDFTPPSVNITSPASLATLIGTHSFNVSISDVLTGLNTVIFQFSNGSFPFNRTPSNTSGIWNVTLNTTSVDDGSLTLTVFANDSAGNINNTQSLSVTIDNVVIASPGSGGTASSGSESSSTSAPSRGSTSSGTGEASSSSSATASASEAASAFQSGAASVSVSSAGTSGGSGGAKAYTSSRTYEISIANNLDKTLVVSGLLDESDLLIENEENARKRIAEELQKQGLVDPAAIEKELKILKLLENVELLEVYKTRSSHLLPHFLVSTAVTVPLKPTGKHIEGNLLKDLLLNAEELQNIKVNPGETVKKEIEIRSGLRLDRKNPPRVVFSSHGEKVLTKDIPNYNGIVTGSAVDVDPEAKTLDFYVVIPQQERGGKETFSVEMNVVVKKTNRVDTVIPLKIKLPAFFSRDSKDLFSELYGPYPVNLERGALLGVQYDVSSISGDYEVIGKIYREGTELIAEDHFEIRQ